jgi:hypothetical protein
MTAPLWIDCPTACDLPPADQLLAWATDDRSVVLRFPADAFAGRGHTKASVVSRLAAALPGCRVIDVGGSPGLEHITVLRGVPIPTEVVAANAAGFLAAMQLFRRTATSLARRLAEQAGVAPDEVLGAVLAGHREADLGGGWQGGHHGLGYGFENRVTGQVVDVRLNFGAEFGVLDPYYFALFLKTTPGLESLGRLLRDCYHDGVRVLDYFIASGQLVEVAGQFGTGWVCRDDDQAADPSAPCQAPPGYWGES